MIGPIGTFTVFDELNSIIRKIEAKEFESFSSAVLSRTSYRLTDLLHKDFPNARQKLSSGHLYDMSSNIFELLPDVFTATKPSDAHLYLTILGRFEGARVLRFVRKDYVNNVPNLPNYKVFMSSANGAAGTLGDRPARIVGQPILGLPEEGATETFISVGSYISKQEAQASIRYIMTKFARVLLGVCKTTQHVTPDTWKYVPLQDFTDQSDIDWSQSVSDIDRQLYRKYGLDNTEIEFIESHVKEMN